ncbi:MAG: DNA methyltransferase [Desulfurococcaceae archaeon]
MKVYYVLSGSNEHLAQGELRALLDVYDPNSKLECYTMVCTSTTGIDVASRIIKRAGFVKEAGILLDIKEAYLPSEARFAGEIFEDREVQVTVNKSTVSEKAVKAFLEEARLRKRIYGDCNRRLIFSEGLVFIGVKKLVYNSKIKSMFSRIKPFNRSAAIPPDIAQALVNLSRVHERDIVVDPFAGTGSILLVAWLMGIRGIGVDIDWNLVNGMKTNLEFIKANSLAICGDSQQLSYREIEHIATDLPYGRSAGTHGSEIRALYKSFMNKLDEYMGEGGYACFMAPHWLEDYIDELVSSHSLKLKNRYYDYVHGSLTRVINVVSRH